MIVQLTGPTVHKFGPNPAIQEWLKGNKHKRRHGFVDGEPKLKRVRLQTVELPVDRGEVMIIIIIIVYKVYIASYITCKKVTLRRLTTNNLYGCNRFTSLKIHNSFQPNT